jgi:thiol-disulfide isomerase/thioredoxin
MRPPLAQRLLTALRDPRRWRRWGVEALIFVAIVSAVSLWQNRGLPEGPAPALAGVRTDGTPVKVGAGTTAASGQAAQLVVFWATWCPVCKAEAGNIESLAADWPVVSVAMQSGSAADVTGYLDKEGLKVPALIDGDGALAGDWGVRGVPTHFVLDPAGNIRFRVVGYATTIGLRVRLWWAENFPA